MMGGPDCNAGGPASLLVVLGFLFVTVSSRLTGEVGSTSNPISGMTIATLILTSAIGVARYAGTGHIDWLAACVIGVPAVVGVLLGIRLQRRLPEIGRAHV